MDDRKVQSHFRTCTLCEAMCGIEIQHRGREIVAIRGDDGDPFSRGHICPKAVALQDLQTDPDRLQYPLRRKNGDWEEISWDEALDETATRLKEIQSRHGRDAVGVYYGNPTVHNLGAMLFAGPFARSLRTRNKFSATSVDQLPHHVAALEMFGHQLLLPIPDIDHTDCFVILGGNPLASNGSLMTVPDVRRRLKDLRARGGRLIVVDPRRTETAQMADRWLAIQPGTDAVLLLGILHELHAAGLAAPGRLAGFSSGLEEIGQICRAWPPSRVAQHTGIDAAEVTALARALAGAGSSVIYGRIGASTQEFGGLCQWLINVINIVTGNLDRRGGAMFTLPAIDLVGMSRKSGRAGHFGRKHSRVRGLPSFSGELPVAAMAEEILTPGEGQVRALVTHAGNPVLSTPNGRQLDRALATLEFMVSIDIYLNETTRHAHIILPTTSALERSHYDLIFHVLAVRNTAKYSPPLFEPPSGTRHEWEIFLALQRRMQVEIPDLGLLGGLARFGVRKLSPPDRMVDIMLRAGPYGLRNLRGPRLSLRKLKKAAHGIDLGPLQPCLPARLNTPDRRIHCAPEVMCADVQRLGRRFPADRARGIGGNGFDLRLIGRRHVRSNNSWQHNSHRLVKGPERCTVIMHPDDAAARNIQNGATVRVTSRVGSIELPAEITADIRPGVLSVPHGWGHDRAGVCMKIAEEHPGASINDLTDDQLLDELTGNAALSGVPVKAEPA